MGFHKRYITDDAVLSIYRNSGCQAVIDWYTRGADAIITSGKLASDVRNLMNILPYEPKRAEARLHKVILYYISNNTQKLIFI